LSFIQTKTSSSARRTAAQVKYKAKPILFHGLLHLTQFKTKANFWRPAVMAPPAESLKGEIQTKAISGPLHSSSRPNSKPNPISGLQPLSPRSRKAATEKCKPKPFQIHFVFNRPNSKPNPISGVQPLSPRSRKAATEKCKPKPFQIHFTVQTDQIQNQTQFPPSIQEQKDRDNRTISYDKAANRQAIK